MDGSDWLNAQISNDMLGTHPKGGHSASNNNIYTPLPWQPRENISRKQASRDITGSKKHIYAQERLNPVTSQPKYGRCER